MKLQTAVSQASLIFQKRFPDAVNIYGRPYVASTACTKSHIETTKQKIINSIIRKNCPLKSSYVGERTGLVVRALDSGSGDPSSILDRVGVLFP